MTTLSSEFLKLKHSLSWSLVILLPVLMVTAGSVGTAVGGGFDDGWHTLWIRSVGFYGMAIVPVGIAIVASLTWHPEHRNGNWNALMSGTAPTWKLVAAKTVAIAALAALMQFVLLTAVAFLGSFVFHLPGTLPVDYVVVSMLIVVAQVPVAALQSSLSTMTKSFAVPIAMALLLTGAGTAALLLKLREVAFVLPHALLTQTTQIGSAMTESSFESWELTPASVTVTIAVAVLLTGLVLTATTAILNRTDSRG